ncbi:MAG: hypothetical protein QOE66_2230, partial [Chloroflexota bacterium]|nr:hypothetical protein [Chloroflexota bacterium]
VAKILVHAGDRDAAIDRLGRALDETEVAGIQTTLPFHRFVARHDGFRAGRFSTDWVAETWDGSADRARYAEAAAQAAVRSVAGSTRSPEPFATAAPPDTAASPPTAAPPARAPDPDGWGAVARTEATDRWPV